MTRSASACLLLLVAGAGAPAGVVGTIDARREGPVELVPGAVRVAGQAVPWADVMFVVGDAPVAAAPHALHLAGGEVVAGTVTEISRTAVTLESAALGRREFDRAGLVAVDFVPGLPPPAALAPNTLVRAAGRPLAGTLLWLRDGKLALDAAIGAVELKLDGLARYVFPAAAAPAAPAAGDEVRLVDGSVLRGTVAPAAGALQVEHPLLGRRSFDRATWAGLRRFTGPALALADLRPALERSTPLIRRPTDPPRAVGDAAGGPRRLLIAPRTTLEYDVPGAPGGRYRLTGNAALVAHARGAARIEVRVGDTVLLEHTLAPDGPRGVALAGDVPAGGRLVVTVDFGGRIRFPCDVALDDALLVRQ